MEHLADLIRYRLACLAGVEADFVNPLPRHIPVDLVQRPGEPPLFRREELLSFREEDGSDLDWACTHETENGQPVVVLTEYGDGAAVRHCFPEGIYRLADPFPALGVKALALGQFLSLPEPEQALVRRFLTDRASARPLFRCICYLASYACTGKPLDGAQLPRAVAAFNSNFAGFPAIPDVPAKDAATLLRLGQLHLGQQESSWRILLSVWPSAMAIPSGPKKAAPKPKRCCAAALQSAAP